MNIIRYFTSLNVCHECLSGHLNSLNKIEWMKQNYFLIRKLLNLIYITINRENKVRRNFKLNWTEGLQWRKCQESDENEFNS